MTAPRILVAGIGNIFMGDDAFGSEVARRMLGRSYPSGVKVVDFGIRGLDVAYALLDGHDAVILVDATQRGGAPGTLYVIEPDLAEFEAADQPALIEAHTMSPLNVLRTVKAMGGAVNKLLLVACEPAELGTLEEGRMGLSEPVAAAIEQAVTLVESLLARLLAESETAFHVQAQS
jgi:hydrogenase maturation protease